MGLDLTSDGVMQGLSDLVSQIVTGCDLLPLFELGMIGLFV